MEGERVKVESLVDHPNDRGETGSSRQRGLGAPLRSTRLPIREKLGLMWRERAKIKFHFQPIPDHDRR